MTKIRCMGSGHSWTNMFADDGSWMMDTSGMNEIVWSPDSPYQVRMSMRMCRGKSYSLMPHTKSSFAPSDKMGRAWYTPGSDCIYHQVHHGNIDGTLNGTRAAWRTHFFAHSHKRSQ